MRRKDRGNRPTFPRGTVPPLPTFETPGAALDRMLREKKMLADRALLEKEQRRLAEVKRAFFEGMAAGSDALFHERDPNNYWLESDTRRNLYAGPPLPEDPSYRAKIRARNPNAPRDPERDPGRVLGKDGRI